MDKTRFLPYSKAPYDKQFKKESKRYLAYVKRVFNPYLKKKLKQRKFDYISNYFHTKPKDHIDYILNFKNKHRWKKFELIRFDIEKYYPSIDHEKLKTILVKHYLYSRWARNLEGKALDILLEHKFITRYFKYFLNFLDEYLSYSMFPNKGLLSSNSLTYFLAEIYLFDILYKVPAHIVRWNDDIILISKKPLKNIFKQLTYTLYDYNLNVNPIKTKHIFLFKDNFSYIWFTFTKQTNYVYIEEKRIEEYLLKVNNILFENIHQRLKTKIRKIRKLQFWFFHYYKICKLKHVWKSINIQTRNLVRKYLLKYGSLKHNFYIENQYIYKLWLVDFEKLLNDYS